MNFGLFYSLFPHAKDVRTIDYQKGTLISGGLDNVVVLYQKVDGRLVEVSRCDIFESYIHSVKINPFADTGNRFLVGCKDSKIFVLDHQGNPVKVLQGHTGPVSSLSFINADQFVSGSWDGTAIVWSISQGQKLLTFSGHQHAVAVLAVNNFVITGSQDKALNLWDLTTGKLVKKTANAHDDIIRQIALVPSLGVLTCSNDQSIKVWTLDLQPLEVNRGHSAFVFTAKAAGPGKYFSGSDDKTIRVWDNGKCDQVISVPASVWTLIIDEQNDIICGLSDCSIRVFSNAPGNRASAQELSQFQSECLQASSKKSGMSIDDIIKLPPIEKMAIHPGKKQGQVKVFRNGNIPEAYSWKTNKWQLIGEVMTEAGGQQGGNQPQAPQSKYYPGDEWFEPGEYDHLFNVEDEGSNGITKVIPFNNGDNALTAAEKYCKRQGIGKGYIEQIRKFLSVNSSSTPTVKKPIVEEITNNTIVSFPNNTIIQYEGLGNALGLKNKLLEFNQKVPSENKLIQAQKVHIDRIINLLENVSGYHSWKLDFKEMDTIRKVLLWPNEFKLPVWDLLRAFLKHYQSQALFSGLDLGADTLGPLCSVLYDKNTPEPLCGVIMKVFTNMFIQNTNSNAMITHGSAIIDSLKFLHDRGSINKNIVSGFGSVCLNYSIALTTKNLSQKDAQILTKILDLIRLRLTTDTAQESVNLYCTSLGNIITRYPQLKAVAKFVTNYPQNQIGKDLQSLLK